MGGGADEEEEENLVTVRCSGEERDSSEPEWVEREGEEAREGGLLIAWYS